MSVHLELPKKIKTAHPVPSGTPRLACGAERRDWTEINHTTDPIRVNCGKCVREGRRLGLMKEPTPKEPTEAQALAALIEKNRVSLRKQSSAFIGRLKFLTE